MMTIFHKAKPRYKIFKINTMFFYNNKKKNEDFLDMKAINEEKSTYIKNNHKTTLEDIFFFLGFIGKKTISDEQESCYYSKFWQNNEITPNGFIRFFTIAKLIRDDFLESHMIDYACTFREEPQELKEFMKSMELRKEQRLPNVKKEYNTFVIFHHYFDRFIHLLGVWDDFNMQIYTSPFFIHYFFKLIEKEKWFKDIDKNAIGLNLYKDIDGYLQGKTNYTWKVELSYNIETYIEQKRYIFPILESLEESRNVIISGKYIRESRIIFELEWFSDFNESLFIEKKSEPKTDKKSENKEKEFSFNEESGELFYGWIAHHVFKNGSNRYFIIEMAFKKEKREPIDFADVIKKIQNMEVGEMKDYKNEIKKLNTTILEISKLIEEKYKIKEFFRVKDRAYYRQY